jgi:hypothetical protein
MMSSAMMAAWQKVLCVTVKSDNKNRLLPSISKPKYSSTPIGTTLIPVTKTSFFCFRDVAVYLCRLHRPSDWFSVSVNNAVVVSVK